MPNPRRRRPLSERFWPKVEKTDGCWLWRGTLNGYGYGRITVDGRRVVGAHVASWLLHHDAPPPGRCVLHRCDNPRCVRPDHLFLGDRADNLLDMWGKARARPHGRTPLNDAQVQAIRADRGDGLSWRAIARAHGVSLTHTRRLCGF